MWRVQLAGIDVLFERSWLVTLLLVTVMAGRSALSLMPGDMSPATALALGLGIALALTVSLLLHEFAHAWASIQSGIAVEHIRVHASGALCRRRDPIHQADHQFSVAAAGPLASVAIGVGSLAAAFILELAGMSHVISISLGFIAFANLIIALSNLLPVFPFDGGKVLHAVLWRKSGDRAAAKDRVRHGGRQFARVVVAFGIIMVGWAGEALLGMVIAGFGIYLMFLPPGE